MHHKSNDQDGPLRYTRKTAFECCDVFMMGKVPSVVHPLLWCSYLIVTLEATTDDVANEKFNISKLFIFPGALLLVQHLGLYILRSALTPLFVVSRLPRLESLNIFL